MKKSVFVVAMVVVFALAMAGTAFASWADSGYTSWSGEASAVAGTSPHYGFSTTTKNCSVCHAVHNADPDGEVLLKDTVDNSCTYCHIALSTASVEAPNAMVYGGSEANYTSDIRGNHSSENGATCAGCHAVHSADTIGNGSRILVEADSYTAAGQKDPAAMPGYDAAAVPSSTVIAAWCSGCHPYFYTEYDQVSHVMTEGGGDYAGTSRVAYTGAVSNIGTSICQECHNVTVDNGFPHYTPDVPRWLEDGVTSTVNTALVNNDGVCLRCHTDVGTMF